MAAVILTPTHHPTTTTIRTVGPWHAEFPATHPIYGARPSLRGRFHQFGALVSIPSGAALVTTASRSAHETEAIVYALTAFLMFTTSAAYHRLAQSVLARFWMRRLDHSMIFLHMAGTTTVLALSCIGGSAGRAIVGVAWTLAAVGMALKLTRLTADHDPCCWMFPILGTIPMLAVPGMVLSQRADSALLLVAAFFLYAAGAACFVRKAPDPRPSVFGYHEIWHVFTLLAGACEFLVVLDSVGY